MNFCSQCGDRVHFSVPPDDNRPRYICDGCETIHYENPRVIVGCLPFTENKVLLCKRSIKPRLGMWTLPAGFMENQESLEDGALRETLEEVNANVEILRLHSSYTVVHVNQVYLIFLAKLENLDFYPGLETLETQLFPIDKIPWEELAFSAVKFALERYVEFFEVEFEGVHRGSFNRAKA
jgi:ADP-ribose pyrophosphatase YjhB (NUDIX family)